MESAALDASIITGAFILPDVTFGNNEASPIQTLLRALSLKSFDTGALLASDPRRQVPQR